MSHPRRLSRVRGRGLVLSGGVRVVESRTWEITIIRWCEMKGQEEVAEEQVEVQITAVQTLVSDHHK